MLTQRMLSIDAARGLCACGAALILAIAPYAASAGRIDADTANARTSRLLADQELDRKATGNRTDDRIEENGLSAFAPRRVVPLLPHRGSGAEAPIPEPSSLILFAMGLLLARQSVLQVRYGSPRPGAQIDLVRIRAAGKRAIDLVGAVFGLLVAAPVLALAALAIRLDSPGPILFRQVRAGRDGRPFSMWKLRTMVEDAEETRGELLAANEMNGPVFKIRRDPRVTRVGRVLRRFSIDEVPQMWNVIRGEMSLVGPRPPLPSEVAQYGPYERRRLAVKPGLTCEWQVSGRNQIGFDEWVRLDIDYLENWSLSRDLWLLLRTIPAVARGVGAS